MDETAEAVERAVRARLNSLTKPPGSLGVLEDIVLRLARIRQDPMPSVARKGMYVFCADHGVTDEGVSPFPRSVTRQMALNFLRGGAAINVLCRQVGIEPTIVDAGIEGAPLSGLVDGRAGPGTRNFATEPAMSGDELNRALDAGRQQAEDAARRFDIVGVGEMGIGNTTTAAALLCAYTGIAPHEAAGAGTGLSPSGIHHKARVIQEALELHKPRAAQPLDILRTFGGFEIAAIAGLVLRAHELRLPVVMDGFPSCSAALAASRIRPESLDVVFFAHRSAERGHSAMLDAMRARPLLALDMRLGEGTGAALAMGVIDSAVRLYAEMATFDEAQVDRAR